MLNHIVLMGRLTRDPELRHTGNGTAVASFSLAVVEGRLQLRDWKDKDGNNRRSAEVVADHVYFGDSKRSESDTPPASGDFREIPEDEEGELPF